MRDNELTVNQDKKSACKSSICKHFSFGGGAGSRTRVRNDGPASFYMLSCPISSRRKGRRTTRQSSDQTGYDLMPCHQPGHGTSSPEVDAHGKQPASGPLTGRNGAIKRPFDTDSCQHLHLKYHRFFYERSVMETRHATCGPAHPVEAKSPPITAALSAAAFVMPEDQTDSSFKTATTPNNPALRFRRIHPGVTTQTILSWCYYPGESILMLLLP